VEVEMTWFPLLTGLAAPPAYLDPGSGSFLVQLVIAGALGAALAIRMSWSRIKGFFRRKGTPPPDSEKHGE
jgi:hypothetical protein